MNKEARERFGQKADPTAKGRGHAGVLPDIEHIGRAIATLDEATWGQMQQEYRAGRPKGQTSHNKYLDKYLKWMPGYLYVITGWGGHGKTQLFNELLLNRAVFKGKKSAVWPSENLPPKDYYNGLIHTLTGRPVDRKVANCLKPAEYERAKDFIGQKFVLIDPPTGMPFTPAHILRYFQEAVDKHGVAHCMLDPWNRCDHTAMGKMGGYDAYLTHTVGLCAKWAQDAQQCLVITAHPKRLEENMGYAKTRPVPNGGTIAGGQTWENMAHYIGAMHRPFDFIEGNMQAAYYCHKCKNERDVARRGTVGGAGPDGAPPMVPLEWDEITNRYRWGREKYSPLDDPDVRKIYEVPAATQTQPLFTTAPPVPTKSAPSAAAPPPPPAPITVRSDFEEAPAGLDDIPADMLPNGARPIRLAPQPA